VWETSVILSIGSGTVKWHMKNILDKLGASNKSHAIAIALGQGIIHPE
jgi:DNA-binding CsgD family transcriptional regulator